MTTTIDNNQKVFLITHKSFPSRSYVANLQDVPKICEEVIGLKNVIEFKHLWNNDFKRISKREMNKLFLANQITFRIK